MAARYSSVTDQIENIRVEIDYLFTRLHDKLNTEKHRILAKLDTISEEYTDKNRERFHSLRQIPEIKAKTQMAFRANNVASISTFLIETDTLLDKYRCTLEKEINSQTIEFDYDDDIETRLERFCRITVKEIIDVSTDVPFDSSDVRLLRSLTLNSSHVNQFKRNPEQLRNPDNINTSTERQDLTLNTMIYGLKTHPLNTAGPKGKRTGELNIPCGVDIDKDTGNIYIVDRSNYRVQIFSSDLAYVKEFNCPINTKLNLWGICIVKGFVFISEDLNFGLLKFKLDGVFVKTAGVRKHFKLITSLAADDDTGNIYACDFNLSRILIFDQELEFISFYTTGNNSNPLDIKIFKDKIYVLNNYAPCIRVFNRSGQEIDRFISCGRTAIEETQFGILLHNNPSRVNHAKFFTIDSEGFLIISDYKSNCLKVFTLDGKFCSVIGREGNNPGEFKSPTGLIVDNAGRLVTLCNRDKNQIQIF